MFSYMLGSCSFENSNLKIKH